MSRSKIIIVSLFLLLVSLVIFYSLPKGRPTIEHRPSVAKAVASHLYYYFNQYVDNSTYGNFFDYLESEFPDATPVFVSSGFYVGNYTLTASYINLIGYRKWNRNKYTIYLVWAGPFEDRMCDDCIFKIDIFDAGYIVRDSNDSIVADWRFFGSI